MSTPPVSFVAHAQSHAAHNHYLAAPEWHAPPVSAPPSASPGSNPAIGPPAPGPAATVNLSPAAQALPQAPSTETPPSPSPSAQAYDSNGAATAPHEGHEGGNLNLRG